MTKTKQWEKEFNKKFGDDLEKRDGVCQPQPCECCDNTSANIKQFISTLLAQQEKEYHAKTKIALSSLVAEVETKAREAQRQEIIEKGESMKRKCEKILFKEELKRPEKEHNKDKAYNQAISDYQTKIKTLKEK